MPKAADRDEGIATAFVETAVDQFSVDAVAVFLHFLYHEVIVLFIEFSRSCQLGSTIAHDDDLVCRGSVVVFHRLNAQL